MPKSQAMVKASPFFGHCLFLTVQLPSLCTHHFASRLLQKPKVSLFPLYSLEPIFHQETQNIFKT